MSGWTPIAPWKLGTSQDIVTGAASVSLATPVGAQTRALLITATASCRIRIGQPTQTAVATDTLIIGNAKGVILGCSPGDIVAAIQEAAAGKCNVTELTH